MAIFKPHSIKIHPDSVATAVILTDIVSLEDQHEPEHRAEVTAPNVSPTHVALVARRPMVRGSTYDLVQFLDTVGVSGLAIKSTTNPGVVTYWQKFDDQGGAVSGENQRSNTYGNGLLVPRMLRIDHQGDARLDFELYVIGDGSNAPVVAATSASLPSISQAAARWTMGPITINNVSLSRYKSIEIDFGNQVTVDGAQSYVDPLYIAQRTHAPKITITGVDPAWFASSPIPIGGAVVANSTDKIFLRKRSQDGSNFVADGTSGHIKIVPAGLASIGQAQRAEMQRPSETTIVITAAKDSSGNNPLVVTTATTIS